MGTVSLKHTVINTNTANACIDYEDYYGRSSWRPEPIPVPELWEENCHHCLIGPKGVCKRYLQSYGLWDKYRLERNADIRIHPQIILCESRIELHDLADEFIHSPYMFYWSKFQIHLLPGYSELFSKVRVDGHDYSRSYYELAIEQVQEIFWGLAIGSFLNTGHEVDIETGFPAILKAPPTTVWPSRYHAEEMQLSVAERDRWEAIMGHPTQDQIDAEIGIIKPSHFVW